jgi:hypothetical protein
MVHPALQLASLLDRLPLNLDRERPQNPNEHSCVKYFVRLR